MSSGRQTVLGWVTLILAVAASGIVTGPHTPIVAAIFGATLVIESKLGGKL